MTKNTTGGNKNKKKKRSRPVANFNSDTVPMADDGNIYGLVTKRLGGTRVMLECSDSVNRQGVIRGKLYKKIYIKAGDIVLCQLEELNNQPICYILYKYNEKERKILKLKGEILFQEEIRDEEQDMIEFSDDEDDSSPQNNKNKSFDWDNNPNLNNKSDKESDHSDNSDDNDIALEDL